MSISYVVGGLLILHAGYSSYEHHQFLSSTDIPTDIILELVIGLVVLNFGVLASIINTPRLGIAHSQVVKHANRYLRPIEMSAAMDSINALGVSEFEEFDTRVEFLDIRQKRKEYLEWAGKN
ncbi:CIC11C00000004091 [Sungouiella intermedia]|uniref:CIC11C00000004091 n=1 Tax=Sungouiella intermedia TaxID=45354 RepID=A0A1L0BCU0_9ASCO|nr:CIC11C00000004091 [[Candida] intermedia]SGZ48956.1 CIC11C00000004263 [[Candida] intermedia]